MNAKDGIYSTIALVVLLIGTASSNAYFLFLAALFALLLMFWIDRHWVRNES